MILQLTSKPKMPVMGKFAAVAIQLEVDEGILFRSMKFPVEGTVCVPVIPNALVHDVVRNAHLSTGLGNWQMMYRLKRNCGYFPGIASTCNGYLEKCTTCKVADGTKGGRTPPICSGYPKWSMKQGC